MLNFNMVRVVCRTICVERMQKQKPKKISHLHFSSFPTYCATAILPNRDCIQCVSSAKTYYWIYNTDWSIRISSEFFCLWFLSVALHIHIEKEQLPSMVPNHRLYCTSSLISTSAYDRIHCLALGWLNFAFNSGVYSCALTRLYMRSVNIWIWILRI